MIKLISFFLKTISYQFAFEKAKRKSVLIYLKIVSAVRKSLILAILLFVTLQLMVIGMIGAIVSGVWLLPIEDHAVRIWILFSFFATLFLIPFIILVIAFSEKTWLKISRATELMK